MSVGTKGQRYDHPNDHVFNAIRNRNMHLLCTQATGKCGISDASRTRASVSAAFRERGGLALPMAPVDNECPCAGTVVIDLADTPQIRQPNTAFHRDAIIKPHYKKHQCVLQYDNADLHRVQDHTASRKHS